MFGLIDFQSLSLWLNLGIFAVAAGVVWFVGTQVARYTDRIAELTGLGRAFIGALLLAAGTFLAQVGDALAQQTGLGASFASLVGLYFLR